MPDLFVSSSLLPVPHAFSVRAGGVSEGPYASLNLGFSVGDARDRVEENLRRFARALGLQASALATVSQVHGDRVLRASAAAASDEIQPVVGEADALWTNEPGVAVGVKTADCVPILIAEEGTGRVAAVHSGWRGTDARIVARAVEALVADGAAATRLIAAIGPAIQRCCYEVSEELAQRFEAKFGADVVSRDGGHKTPHLDLARAVKRTLEQSGLRPDRIDVLAHCTSCDAARFFSHRRDKGVSGRHLSVIVGGVGAAPR